jgi:hypothetical protein
MSWLYSQALVAEYLGEKSLDGEQSALSNGNHTQQAYCAPDKMTAFSRLSRFGMTYKPLTENLGEELLTSYLAAFHAKTSPLPEKEQDLTESEAECGSTWRGWLAKYDPSSSLWRTAQCSLLGEEPESLQTLPRYGMTRDGLLWELPMLEQTIRGTESGLSPDGQTTFHTPNTTGLDGGSNSRKALKKKKAEWASPNARDWKDSGASQGKRKSPNLGTQVHWPTPRTKGMCGGTGSWNLLNKNTTPEEARAMGAGNGGKLNPTWVEWLMGWPLEWTDLKPLATDKSHCVLQQPGKSLADE